MKKMMCGGKAKKGTKEKKGYKAGGKASKGLSQENMKKVGRNMAKAQAK